MEFEVKCLQNSATLPEHILLQSIRNSLKGVAREIVVSLGEGSTVSDIIEKLDGFYGNVSSSETLVQSFYMDFQKETESIVQYGSRLEQTLARAIRYGHIDLVAKDTMLRSKFWTGLKSQQLRNATRYLYAGQSDFQTLLREVRKVEQEESATTRTGTKSKTAQQHTSQASSESNDQMLKTMNELVNKMKSMESQLSKQQQTLDSLNQYSFNDGGYRNQYARGRGRGNNRGYRGRGQPWKGFDKKNNSEENSEESNTNERGDNGSGYRSKGYRGGYSRAGRWRGSGGRGNNAGDQHKRGSQNLN